MQITPETQKICMQCKECCRWMTFILTRPTQSLLEAYRARGCKVKTINENFHIMVPSVCPHLSDFGCSIYHTRPRVCRDYDGRLDPVMCDRCRLPI